MQKHYLRTKLNSELSKNANKRKGKSCIITGQDLDEDIEQNKI